MVDQLFLSPFPPFSFPVVNVCTLVDLRVYRGPLFSASCLGETVCA